MTTLRYTKGSTTYNTLNVNLSPDYRRFVQNETYVQCFPGEAGGTVDWGNYRYTLGHLSADNQKVTVGAVWIGPYATLYARRVTWETFYTDKETIPNGTHSPIINYFKVYTRHSKIVGKFVNYNGSPDSNISSLQVNGYSKVSINENSEVILATASSSSYRENTTAPAYPSFGNRVVYAYGIKTFSITLNCDNGNWSSGYIY